ncbi:MAG TPA: hypothetical protein VIN71_00785 [Pseudomonadales bacterium]
MPDKSRIDYHPSVLPLFLLLVFGLLVNTAVLFSGLSLSLQLLFWASVLAVVWFSVNGVRSPVVAIELDCHGIRLRLAGSESWLPATVCSLPLQSARVLIVELELAGFGRQRLYFAADNTTAAQFRSLRRLLSQRLTLSG